MKAMMGSTMNASSDSLAFMDSITTTMPTSVSRSPPMATRPLVKSSLSAPTSLSRRDMMRPTSRRS